jgi:hypothetical protein
VVKLPPPTKISTYFGGGLQVDLDGIVAPCAAIFSCKLFAMRSNKQSFLLTQHPTVDHLLDLQFELLLVGNLVALPSLTSSFEEAAAAFDLALAKPPILEILRGI